MRIVFCALFLTISSIFANEIANLEALIATTQSQLDKQQKALILLKQFQQTKAAFITKSDDARLGTQLVKISMQLHTTIASAHLTHLFTAEFLEEVAFFNDVGEKHRLQP